MCERVADGRECNLVPGYIGITAQSELQRLGAGVIVEVEQARAKQHVDLIDVRNVVKSKEVTDFHVGVRLFECLALGAVGGRLAVFEKPGRHGPQSITGLDRALAQQHAIFPGGYAPDDDLRILIMDRAARIADVARQRIAGWYTNNNAR